jgi:hypothetical protein
MELVTGATVGFCALFLLVGADVVAVLIGLSLGLMFLIVERSIGRSHSTFFQLKSARLNLLPISALQF